MEGGGGGGGGEEVRKEGEKERREGEEGRGKGEEGRGKGEEGRGGGKGGRRNQIEQGLCFWNCFPHLIIGHFTCTQTEHSDLQDKTFVGK